MPPLENPQVRAPSDDMAPPTILIDKLRLAESVVQALLQRPLEPLPPPQSFEGAGIYALQATFRAVQETACRREF